MQFGWTGSLFCFLSQHLHPLLQKLLAALELIDAQVHLTDGRHTALSCLTNLHQLNMDMVKSVIRTEQSETKHVLQDTNQPISVLWF